jgi:hypothetical protein
VQINTLSRNVQQNPPEICIKEGATAAISIYPMAVRDVSRTFWQLTGTFFQAYFQTCFML